MRILYSLILVVGFAFSLQAQLDLSAVSNDGSFYITDTSCEDANPYDGIIWPCDFETNNCDILSNSSVTGEPVITSNEFNEINITFEDVTYHTDSSFCNKILRKWKVVDKRLHYQNAAKGTWEYVQELRILKSAPPVFISDTHDKEFCLTKYDCSPDFITLKAVAIDDCTADAEIDYYYEIDLNNNGKVDYNGDTNDASDIFPYGKHKITWFAKDGCDNITQCEYFFKVKDCKPPTPNCINGLMIELSSDKGEVIIQATDFDQGSYDNCELEEFRVVSPSKGEGQTLPPSAGFQSVAFDCSSKGVNSVDFWIKDKNGNWDYCTTYVIVQDNQFNCNEDEVKENTLGQEISRFVEEIPLEIEKMYVPYYTIQQSENAGFKIYPSQPNPFEVETKISFDLEKNTEMKLTIQDVSGNIVKIIEKEFFAGFNQIMLQKEDFKEAGIFFFTLQSNTHKSTGKIVLIQR